MTEHQVATHEQWQAARRELLEQEREHAERRARRGHEFRVTRHDQCADSR